MLLVFVDSHDSNSEPGDCMSGPLFAESSLQLSQPLTSGKSIQLVNFPISIQSFIFKN